MIKGAKFVSARLSLIEHADNRSGFSACQRDSNVSMTNLVSAEDDVNLRVSKGLSAAIDEGRRRRR